MKKSLFFVVFFMFILIGGSFASDILADKVEATVEGVPITTYELRNLSGFYHAKDKQNLLNQVVNDYVIVHYAKNFGIMVTDDDVDRFVESMAKKNSMSESEFIDKIKKSGVDFEYYKKGVRLKLYRRKFSMKMFASSIKISDDEVKSYYNLHKDEIKVEPVFVMSIIAVNNRGLSEKIYSLLKKGQSFDALKRKYSLDKDKAKNIPLSAFNKEIRTQLEGLSIGDYSNIIESSNMFYIVKIVDKKNFKNDFQSLQGVIRSKLFDRKITSKLNGWLKAVKNRTDIEIFDET